MGVKYSVRIFQVITSKSLSLRYISTKERRKDNAYPNGIPEAVYWTGHFLPKPNDNGVQFEARDDADKECVCCAIKNDHKMKMNVIVTTVTSRQILRGLKENLIPAKRL